MAEACVVVGLGAAQAVVRARRDAVRAEDVPERGRVGAAGDEAGHVAAGRDQVVPADVLLDARAPCPIVAEAVPDCLRRSEVEGPGRPLHFHSRASCR